MRETGHKGEDKRPIGNLVWLPIIVALVVQYGLAAALFGANGGKASDALHASAPSVTYEVSVTQNGQVLSSSTKEDAFVAASADGSSEGSAAEAFLQAAGESDAVNALRGEERLTFESARARIKKEAALAKAKTRQANKERADHLRFGSLLKQAEDLKGLKVRGYDISDERMVQLVDNPPSYTADIEFIDQGDLLPSGCEIVSLTVVLHSMGYDDADPIEIADKYVEYGGDSAKYYTGSPYGDGGGFPPCIVNAANKWLKDNGGGAKAYNLTGSSFEALCALVELGYPVLVWTTDDMVEPYVGSDWYQPEHCVVMYGTEKAAEQKSKPDSGKKSEEGKVRSSSASQDKSEGASSASSASASSSSAARGSSSASSKATSSFASSSSASVQSSATAGSSGSSSSKSSSASSTSKGSSSAASAKSASSAASSPSSSGSSSSAASVKPNSSAASSSSAASVKSKSSSENSKSAASSKSASPTSSSSGVSTSSSSAASSKSSSSAASASGSSASKSSSAAAQSPLPSAASKKKDDESSSESSNSSSASPAPAYAYVKVSDSLVGLVKRDYSDFKDIYEKAGKRALFIQPDNS